MIAFLAQNLKHAVVDIRDQFELCEFQPSQARGTVRYEGIEMPFRIVTREDHLRGLELVDFFTLAPVKPALEQVAKARMRLTLAQAAERYVARAT